MIDGNPVYPDLSFQWRLAEETEPTFFGLEPRRSLMACRKAGLEPGARPRPLVGSAWSAPAGSPLPARGLRLALRAVRPGRAAQRRQRRHRRVHGARPGRARSSPCTRARSSARVPRRRRRRVRRRTAEPVVGELGELVIRQPMPSMPVALLERPRRLPLPRRVLRLLSRASGASATGSCSPSTAAASSPAAPTRP